jgi:hypothetical protein
VFLNWEFLLGKRPCCAKPTVCLMDIQEDASDLANYDCTRWNCKNQTHRFSVLLLTTDYFKSAMNGARIESFPRYSARLYRSFGPNFLYVIGQSITQCATLEVKSSTSPISEDLLRSSFCACGEPRAKCTVSIALPSVTRPNRSPAFPRSMR